MKSLRKSFRSALSRLYRLVRSGGGCPTAIDPRQFQPPLPVPAGYTRKGILDALISVSIDGSKKGELTGYATADLERFLRTLELVPTDAGRVLEIGANPYFNTLLMRHFRPQASLTLTNYFNGEPGVMRQQVSFSGFNGRQEEFPLEFHNLNIEQHQFPFDDASFDTVVFCEVLEHLTIDPMAAMSEISRVLAPNGVLVLTTPNAARLENVIALVEGRNLYDPYSAYGPYGRHNREYTRHELHQLLIHCGFLPEVSYTGNVHDDIPGYSVSWKSLEILKETPNREFDLGQYFFTRWRKVNACDQRLPHWLYRSYPESRMAA
jgi:SAM-dependent methyltransferase